MSVANNLSFSSPLPFEIKIENQFMNEGHSTLYIVNKVDEAATEQHVKLLINTVAFGDYALKGFGKENKPDSTHYNLAIAFRPGTLLKSVEDVFQKILEDAMNEALKDKGNSCKVSGPVVNERDQAKVWYVCFEQDVDANQEQITGLSESLLPQNDPGIPFSHITGGPDGTYYAIDKWDKLHYYDPQQSQWIKYSWGGHVKSIVAMPNKQFQYVGSDQQLNPATHAPDGPWMPYNNPSILLQNNARYGASDQIGVDPGGHLIKITFSGTRPTTKILSSKMQLISACTLPNRHILGVDINHKLHLWNEVRDSWASITTSENQKFLMVSVDYNNQLVAVGIDHQLYQLGHAVVGQNLLTVNLKGVSAEAGNGSRVTQVACQFGNVKNVLEEPVFQFKSTTQINIVNHQGSGYAPLHFGVLGNDVMIAHEKNSLKTYFLTKERLPITLSEKTTFTFTFPGQDEGSNLPGIGTSSEIEAFTASNPDELFDPEVQKPDITHHTWDFPFKANHDAIGKAIHQGVFEFGNIQVSRHQGPVIIEIKVKNLPGYWDSVFQIPVVIGSSALTEELSLAQTSIPGGNTDSDGSKIYFLSGGVNQQVPKTSIEAYRGLNFYANQNVRLRGTDLLIPEGKVAIGTARQNTTGDQNDLIYPDSTSTLFVQGDSQLNGGLTIDHLSITDKSSDGSALSISANGTVQVDAPNEFGGRFNIDENGNVSIGKGSLWVAGETKIDNAITCDILTVGDFMECQGNQMTMFWGRVGIGTDAPRAPLDVRGAGQSTIRNAGRYMDAHGYGSNNDETPISIYSEYTVCASRLVAQDTNIKSDKRIKTNVNSSDNDLDLARLLNINIRDYTHVDLVKQGNRKVKGIIAQELEEVFPEAVSKMSEFIPDIYQLCEQFDIDEDAQKLTCTLKQPHGLIKNDRVKLISDKDQEFFQEVVAIIDDKSFVVGDWTEKVEGIFVFGKEVDDFRTVDYTQVSMMGISAIQALHKEKDVLKKENEVLKQTYESIKEENAALKDQLLNEMQSLRAEMEALKATTI